MTHTIPPRSHRQITGVIRSQGRLPSSYYGNPTCTLVLEEDDGTMHEYRTETDASVGYAAENYKIDDRVTLHFHKRHRVTFFHMHEADQ